MADYTFSFHQAGQLDGEPGTIDLPNDAAAWEEMTTAAGEMLRDLDGNLRPGHEWAVEVRREGGQLLYRVRILAEAPGEE